eukprot:5291742-Alexandrium_andersonii.AAC.1
MTAWFEFIKEFPAQWKQIAAGAREQLDAQLKREFFARARRREGRGDLLEGVQGGDSGALTRRNHTRVFGEHPARA